MTTEPPPIQLIANLVVEGEPGQVLLARYNPERETDESDAATRWWLPAHELEPYQHPDDAARIALDEIGGLAIESSTLSRVQSFRGRRGWHISFDFHVMASGEPASTHVPRGLASRRRSAGHHARELGTRHDRRRALAAGVADPMTRPDAQRRRDPTEPRKGWWSEI